MTTRVVIPRAGRFRGPRLIRSHGAPHDRCSRRPRGAPRLSRARRSRPRGDLRIGTNQPFDSPNPFQAVEAIAVDSYSLAYYDQLTGLKNSDQSVTYQGALASGADVSADGKTITFHLRKGIHWSDGTPFTSADCVYTFNAVLKNQTNQLHTTIIGVTSVSAPDADTFVLHLSTRDSEFLAKLAIPILPKHVWDKIPIAKLDKVNGPDPGGHDRAVACSRSGTRTARRSSCGTRSYDMFRNGGKVPAVKRILITAYQNTDAVYRDVAQGNLDVAFNGPANWAPRAKRTRTCSCTRRRAAATGRSRSTRARRRARRSAAARPRASR